MNSLRQHGTLAVGIIACAVLLGLGVSREVPRGRLEGTVTMNENGKPLRDAEIILKPQQDEEGDLDSIYLSTDKNGHFRSRPLTAGLYKISVVSSHHNVNDVVQNVEEGKVNQVQLSTFRSADELYASLPQHVILPTQEPEVQVNGFIADESVAISVWRISDEALIANGGPQGAVRAARTSEFAKFVELATKINYKPKARDLEGAFVDRIKLPTLSEGIYAVEFRGGRARASVALYVTQLAMVTKSSPKEQQVFVTDIVSGQPVSGAPVFRSENGRLVAAGTTDVNGHATCTSGENKRSMLIAKAGKSWASTEFFDGDSESDEGRIAVVTDRSIYRPGDLVQYKAIIRKKNGTDLALPALGKVEVEILDTEEETISQAELSMNAHGSVSGSFSTSREAKPGVYQIHCTSGDIETRKYVSIVAYRKPDFVVKVKPRAQHFVYGQKVVYDVDLTYYFGGPVVGAKINAMLTRDPLWDASDAHDDEPVESSDGPWNYGSGGGSGAYVGDIKTETDDRGHVTLEFPTKTDEDAKDPLTQDYTYTVNLYCSETEGSPSIDGTGSALVTRGDYSLSVHPESYVSNAEVPTKVRVNVRQLDGKKEPVSGATVGVEMGKANWDQEKSWKPYETLQLTTDSNGQVDFLTTKGKSGSIDIRVTVTDRAGHKIQSGAYVYATDRDSANADRLDLTLDKREYREGQTASALISTKYPGGMAWVTIEGSSITWSKFVNLRQNVTRVEIPVDHTAFPGAFVNVAYVRLKQYQEVSRRLTLTRVPKKLTVVVTPDRAQVLPGQKVGITIATTDSTGKPVSADTTVAAVDESLFALQADRTDLIHDFYPSNQNLVRTSYSFPEIYLDGGDKGASSVTVRSKFLDTATWIPFVQTGVDGKAHVEVTLPDNLTDWRITATGATDDTIVGLGVAHVIAKKPVMIRATVPRFMVKGDSEEVAITVHNDSGESQALNLLVTTKGIQIEDNVPKTISLGSGESKDIVLRATAADTGEAFLEAKAWKQGGLSDGVRVTMPVHARGRLVHSAQSLSVDGSATTDITIPESYDRPTASARIQVSPTIAGSLLASLDSLVQYPYGCVEQTMSRFMPALLVQKLLRENGLEKPKLDEKVARIATDSLARLKKMQHSDGAWGWWEYDDSNVHLTALVLDGLDRAKQAGQKFDVKTDRALEWLANRCSSKYVESDRVRWTGYSPSDYDYAYAAYVLARYGKAEASRAALAAEPIVNRSMSALSMMALTHLELGNRSEADKLLALLVKSVDRRAGFTGWYDEWRWSSERTQPTALGILALLKADLHKDITDDAVKGLMKLRRGSMWESTQATSYSIVALTEYLHRTKELVSSRTVDISVGGKSTMKRSWPVGDFGSAEIEIPATNLHPGRNAVSVRSTGGTVYVQLDASITEVGAEAKPEESKNLTINRVYRLLEVQTTEDGRKRLLPSKRVKTEFRVGDIVQVEIHVNTDSPIDYVMLEDRIPSNFRIVERESIEEGGEWNYLWDGIQILDNRAALFLSHLVPTKGIVRYTLRAETPGKCVALPVRAEPMYAPHKAVSSIAQDLVVRG